MIYCCETWPLTLKEEGRVRAFENRIPIEKRMGSCEGFTMKKVKVYTVPLI